jgi:hypothetical protein
MLISAPSQNSRYKKCIRPRLLIEIYNICPNLSLENYGEEHSIWNPPDPFPKDIHRVENSWAHPPRIEDFYQQFMRSSLASSVMTVFHKNVPRGVHTVINEKMA